MTNPNGYVPNGSAAPQVPGPQTPSPQSPSRRDRSRHGDKPISGCAIAGCVTGGIGLLTSWIPIFNNVSAIIAVIGVALAVIGLVATRRKGRKRGRGVAIAAVVISVIAIIIVLVTQNAYVKAIDDAGKQVEASQSASKKAVADRTYTFKATSNGPASAVYTNGGGSHTEDFNGSWQITVKGTEAGEFPGLSVLTSDYSNPDPSGIKVSCEILVNGKSVSKHNGTGSGASAICDVPYDWQETK